MNTSFQPNLTSGRARRFTMAAGGLVLLGLLLFIVPYGGKEVRSLDLNILYPESPVSVTNNSDQSVGGNVVYHGNNIFVRYHQYLSPAEAAREMINSRGDPPAQPIGEQACYSVVAAGTKGAELWFRRDNVVVCVLKEGKLMGGITPELDQIEVEAVARILDDAILGRDKGTKVVNTSIGRRVIEAMAYEQLPGLIAMYFLMGGLPLGIAFIPVVLLLLLARRIRPPLAKLTVCCAILAIYLAPGIGAGHGGIYIGPGYFMILGNPAMVPSILITWTLFFVLAAGARWLWTGKLK